MLTKWRCCSWDPARIARVIAHEALQNALFRSLWWLELLDLDESRHEGRHRCCRRNGVVGFGIARAARVIARKARQNTLICSLWWLEVMDFNRHEGGHGRCRLNGVVGFGIARAQCT